MKQEELTKLYQNRFSQPGGGKADIWFEIVRYLQKRFPVTPSAVIDVAAGYCDFINHFCGKDMRRYAYDLNDDVRLYAQSGVEAVVDDIGNISRHFEKESIDLIFMSNFLEHISKTDTERLLEDSYALLAEQGQLWILTPNIRYVGGKYWDFWDHITPITEETLIEAARLKGFSVRHSIKRFLPYTTKSRLPQAGWIVRLYLLLMPFSGRLFGEQSFLVFEKKGQVQC